MTLPVWLLYVLDPNDATLHVDRPRVNIDLAFVFLLKHKSGLRVVRIPTRSWLVIFSSIRDFFDFKSLTETRFQHPTRGMGTGQHGVAHSPSPHCPSRSHLCTLPPRQSRGRRRLHCTLDSFQSIRRPLFAGSCLTGSTKGTATPAAWRDQKEPTAPAPRDPWGWSMQQTPLGNAEPLVDVSDLPAVPPPVSVTAA
jgi:hypothetical protein